MVAIAFSLLLVILAVFVLEIFRTTQKILLDLEELREDLREAPPSLAALGEDGPLPESSTELRSGGEPAGGD